MIPENEVLLMVSRLRSAENPPAIILATVRQAPLTAMLSPKTRPDHSAAISIWAECPAFLRALMVPICSISPVNISIPRRVGFD